ncbi:methyltransferase HEMK2 isoform X1 [Lampetra fluviatilis]
MLPTPRWQGGEGRVYEPSEDTFLLMAALEGDAERLRSSRTTDINHDAAHCTSVTASLNQVMLQPIITDLVHALLPRLSGSVDLLLFNPPYVVTESSEVGLGDVSSSWAGGARGREVVDRLLPLVTSLLSPSGAFYLVCEQHNAPGEVMAWFRDRGFSSSSVNSQRAGTEILSVLRIERSTS